MNLSDGFLETNRDRRSRGHSSGPISLAISVFREPIIMIMVNAIVKIRTHWNNWSVWELYIGALNRSIQYVFEPFMPAAFCLFIIYICSLFVV